MTTHYRLAIIGGGCAGLSLASELIRIGFPGRIVIIEPRSNYENDRTWCFWASENHKQSYLVSKRWSNWDISTATVCARHQGNKLSYQQIRSIDFYTAMMKQLETASSIKLKLGVKAEAVIEKTDYVQIKTEADVYSADFAIDTRPPSFKDNSAQVWQVFSGGEVETVTPCFDSKSAGLMTQMQADENGLKFLYILPQSDRRALIQTTLFSLRKIDPTALDPIFMEDLTTVIDGPLKILRWERGLLPMGLNLPPQIMKSRVLKAGLPGGALRASSGYAFTRIQDWAERAAYRMSQGSFSLDTTYGSAFETAMDKVFLKALSRRPIDAGDWFVRIAGRLTGDDFARFMSRSPDAKLWLRVVAALPKMPFLAALVSSSSPGNRSDLELPA
ncbi:MAG: lycopene cyclase family protein [Pseudomonadota bacterium]